MINDPRRGTLRMTQWPSIWSLYCLEPLSRKPSWPAFMCERTQQAGHMGASDLIKTLQIHLARRVPSTYGSWTWSSATTNAGSGQTTLRPTSPPLSTWPTICSASLPAKTHSGSGGRSPGGMMNSSPALSPHDFFTRFACKRGDMARGVGRSAGTTRGEIQTYVVLGGRQSCTVTSRGSRQSKRG